MCDKSAFRPANEAIAGRPRPVVLLKCPVCKSRWYTPDDMQILDVPCKIQGCPGMLVYARDVPIAPPKKPEELYAEKQKRAKK